MTGSVDKEVIASLYIHFYADLADERTFIQFGSMYGAPPHDMSVFRSCITKLRSSPDDVKSARVAILPTQRALDEDVYMFRASGPGLDVERAMVDHEHLFEFLRKTTKITDLEFGDVKTLNNYKYVHSRLLHSCQLRKVS